MPDKPKRVMTASELIARAVIADSRKRARDLAKTVKQTAAELQSNVESESKRVQKYVEEKVVHQRLDSQTFDLLMARFDTIEGQNAKQLDLIASHVKDDDSVRVIVDRHTTYFSLLTLGLAPAAAYLANKLGFPKLG